MSLSGFVKAAVGIAMVAGLASVVQADIDVPLTFDSLGTSGVAAGNSSYAITNGSGNVELYNETGSGFAWVRYNLSTPQPLGDITGLTYTIRVLDGGFPFGNYIANPILVIDADNDSNHTANPPVWIDSLNPADLGGDAIYSSDAMYSGLGSTPEASLHTMTLIGPGSIIDTGGGWYHSNAAQNALNFSDYYPWSSVLGAGHLPHDGIDASDLVYAVYIVDGGSAAFVDHKIEISNVALSVPEPASLVLLCLGSVLIFKRHRVA